MRRRALVRLLSLSFAALAAGCSGSVEESVGATDEPTPGAEEMPEATVGVASTVEEIPGSRDIPFVVRREVSGGSSYEADTVLAVRHGVHEDYERAVVDLGTGRGARRDGARMEPYEPDRRRPVARDLPVDERDPCLGRQVWRRPARELPLGARPRGWHVRGRLRAAGVRLPGDGALGPGPARPGLQAARSATGRAVTRVGRRHGAHGPARGHPDPGPADHQRLLPQLRGLEHRGPDGLRRRGPGPADRHG